MSAAPEPRSEDDLFRWQALFQHTQEPLFLLNRRRRLLFANRAWEELTGIPWNQVRRWTCKRYLHAEPGSWEAVAQALHPPVEALQGQIVRVRRLFLAADRSRRWWDVDFVPLRDDKGIVAFLGKITRVTLVSAPGSVALPEKVAALRQTLAQRYRFETLFSHVPAGQRILEQARLAAQTLAPVLLVGEPGTGKGWLARTIHHQGSHREKTFVALDCAGLPGSVVGPLLLGPGSLLQRRSIGTLYLRDVAALPRDIQAQLQASMTEPGRSGPRLIASLPRPPEMEIQAQRLLPELFCSLATLPIHLLPLRERLADLPFLVERLLERINRGAERSIRGLTAEAWEVLQRYSWPGNLHELDAVLLVARQRATSDLLEVSDLPCYLRQTVQLQQIPGRPMLRLPPLDKLLENVERRLITLALRKACGNKKQAAELLSIWRASLLSRIKKLGIVDPVLEPKRTSS